MPTFSPNDKALIIFPMGVDVSMLSDSKTK
jgi:hypothetical protein